MEVNIAVVISGACAICGVIFGLLGYISGRKKECREDAKEDGASKVDMKYVIRRVDDILLEQKDTNKGVNQLSERVTRTEESLKSLHKRMDMEVKDHA